MSHSLANSQRTGAFDIEVAPRWIVRSGQAAALLGCTAAPWMFGCFRFREARWLYLALSISLVFGTIAVFIRAKRAPASGSLRVPILLVPMFAGIALGAAQLLPIPQTLTGATVDQVPELAGVELGEPIRSQTLSFHPTATKQEIGRYAFAIATFLIGYVLFRTPESQRLLWATVLLNGVVLTVFGLIQQFTWNEKLFWTVPLRFGGDPFASFVNRNNAMAFIYLAGAGGVGLLVWAFERRPVRATVGIVQACLARLATIDATQVVLLLSIALLGGGAVASTSRSGVLSFAVASFVVLVFVAAARKAVWPLGLAIIAVGVTAGVVYSLQIDEELKARIAKLDPEKIETRTRILHAKDALNVTASLPALGAGLGSHAYVHLPFVSDQGRRWAVNADNQYIEIAVESGVAGLMILALLWAFLTRLFWVSRSGFPEVSGTAAALLFLLCANSVHAMFDFGIILPATLCASSLLVGAFVAAISSRTGGRGASLWTGRFALPTIMFAVCALAGFGLSSTATAARLEVAKSRKARELSDSELDVLIAGTASIPGADAGRWHAELLIERYERSARADIRKALPNLPDKAVTQAGSLDKLYTRIQEFRRRDQNELLDSTLALEPIQRDLVPALQRLKSAVAECPVLPDTYNLVGQLSGVLEPEAALPAFERAILVEPMQDKAVGLAGCNLMEVKTAEGLAITAIRHSMNTPRWRVRREILAELDGRYGLRYLVSEICPSRDSAAIGFIHSLRSEKRDALAERVLAERLAMSPQYHSVSDAIARAQMHRLAGDSCQTITVLTDATERYPGSAAARHNLAQALHVSGDLPGALLQARAACALEPGEARYSEFLQSLEAEISRNRNPIEPDRRDSATNMMQETNTGQAGRRWI